MKLIVSDFDRTLFNVNEFFVDFCDYILGEPELHNQELRAEVEEFLHSGDHSDWHAFMDKYHADLTHILDKVKFVLNKNSYLYEDVADFLGRFKADKIAVLTTGRQEYQQVKLQLAGELDRIIKKVIPGNKSEYLKKNLVRSKESISVPDLTGSREFSGLYLIDDKMDMLLPLLGEPNVKLFHIQRPDAKFLRESSHEGIHNISTLLEVE